LQGKVFFSLTGLFGPLIRNKFSADLLTVELPGADGLGVHPINQPGAQHKRKKSRLAQPEG
jgi:hypothetical protein